MPIYSGAKPASISAEVMLVCGSGTSTIVVAAYEFGEGVDPTLTQAGDFVLYGPTAVQAITPEKLNSRSRLSIGSISSGTATPTASLVLASTGTVSFQAWRGDFRRCPINWGGLEAASRVSLYVNRNNANANSAVLIFSEGVKNYTSRFRRARNAFFFRADNYCCLHKVTGGGAFEWTSRPHFLNDGITWLDERIWDNGYSQGDIWNINLFAGAVDVSVDGTGLGVVASALTGQVLFYVNFGILGVAAVPLIGAGVFDSSIVLIGVGASPLVGTISSDVSAFLASVAAAPAIGSGTFVADIIITASGIGAASTLGSFTFDAGFTLGSVAATPMIGSGSVDTPLAECRAMDFYSETNQDSTGKIGSDTSSEMAGGLGQCFTGNGEKIVEVRWYLYRQSAETLGNAVCKIWSLTGSFGTTGNVSTLLATSDLLDVSTIPGVYTIMGFAFSGANQYITTNSTHYVATIEYTGSTDTGQFLGVGYDGSSGTHPGNFVFHNQSTGGVWTAGDGSIDVCFYVCGVPIDVTVTAAGVAAAPAIGAGSVEIEALIVSHPTEPIRIRIPRKIKQIEKLPDVRIQAREGVAAPPPRRDNIGVGRFDVATSVPPLPYEMTVFDPLALIDITCPFGAGPISVVSLGKGIVRITPELYDDEIAALLSLI